MVGVNSPRLLFNTRVTHDCWVRRGLPIRLTHDSFHVAQLIDRRSSSAARVDIVVVDVAAQVNRTSVAA